MSARPKLKLEKRSLDWSIELLGWLVLLCSWVYVFASYADLPETIPTHYNGLGKADGFGNKSLLFSLVGIGQALYIGLFVLNFYPHLFNYMTKITEDNALQQYTASTRLIRLINFVIALIFSYLSIKSVHNALNGRQDLDAWVLPVFLCLLFIPLIIYIVKFAKK